MFLTVAAPPIPHLPQTEITFADRTVTTPDGAFAYQVFVPKSRSRTRKPSILFLHGAGERGDDNRTPTVNGVRLMIARNGGANFPALIVVPQCRKDLWWTEATMKRQALAAFDAAMVEFSGDPARQILTGLSMGGYGTWAIASDDPTRWAAIAPVCGGLAFRGQRPADPTGSDPKTADAYFATAQKIQKLPTWVFHGGVDPVVPVSESRQMVASLIALGANVKYTEYPGVGHSSWDNAYAEPKLMSWFLAQRRGKSGR